MNISSLGELLFKLVLTILLCSLIGGEREARNKGAGLRTHILVGLGSGLFVLTSYHIFYTFKNETLVDPTRIITGIVTGIGFLCAGTIIRCESNVIGLTTAATLWIVSGIGMAVGAGLYSAAIVVTLAVFFVLVGVRSLEKRLKNRLTNQGGCYGDPGPQQGE
ncbi:MAG TPA: MgtC/SapB family protein [Candidatus Omnitrophota bacterium]|nr:MgtC/SapB family protein [Candidatus Omnitrophota bacterium]HQO59113.1 MgtC/SapB family protein [Candidatus Omnitrophota bacterium]HQP12459.1 MgtC/SapB family protein [Candidatus Omnitrophota bacterium]